MTENDNYDLQQEWHQVLKQECQQMSQHEREHMSDERFKRILARAFRLFDNWLKAHLGICQDIKWTIVGSDEHLVIIKDAKGTHYSMPVVQIIDILRDEKEMGYHASKIRAAFAKGE